MKRYYISANNQKGFEELTETEFFAIVGDDTHRPYASKVYRGKMALEDVPDQYRATVEALVSARVERCGAYAERDISADELKSMIEGVI